MWLSLTFPWCRRVDRRRPVDVIAKPIDLDLLRATIARLAARPAQPGVREVSQG
jgi:hypothetical protein